METKKLKKIRIGSRDWTIRFKDQIVEGDTECDGLTHPDQTSIEISSQLPADRQGLTLLHEVLHAALHESGYAYIINSDEVEEGFVRAISHILWPLIKARKFDTSK